MASLSTRRTCASSLEGWELDLDLGCRISGKGGGRAGGEGICVARGEGIMTADLSVLDWFHLSRSARLPAAEPMTLKFGEPGSNSRGDSALIAKDWTLDGDSFPETSDTLLHPWSRDTIDALLSSRSGVRYPAGPESNDALFCSSLIFAPSCLTGSVILNDVPTPTALFTSMVPECPSTSILTSGRPIPESPTSLAVSLLRFSGPKKSVSILSGVMPDPVSDTLRATLESETCAPDIRILPHLVNRSALPTRFIRHCTIRSLSPST
mmetsp:Transcript_33965/g.85897  ORF Transcript_33965/g.85897 Transcript_33965/m.85897 type:complete len:266 (+) Transcript_33965:1291-2088(+)